MEYLCSTILSANQLVVVGKPVEEDDLIFYIISGLNIIVTTHLFMLKDNTISFKNFQFELLSHEIFQNYQKQLVLDDPCNFAMLVNKPQHHGPKRFNSCHFPKFLSHNSLAQANLDKPTLHSSSNNPQAPYSSNYPPCQIREKTNEQALYYFFSLNGLYIVIKIIVLLLM